MINPLLFCLLAVFCVVVPYIAVSLITRHWHCWHRIRKERVVRSTGHGQEVEGVAFEKVDVELVKCCKCGAEKHRDWVDLTW